MADRTYRGDTEKIKQVLTLTPTSVESGDKFGVGCNGKWVWITTTLGTVADVCEKLAAAINASAVPEFKEFVASNATTHVLLTAKTGGVPFEVQTDTTNTSEGRLTITSTVTGISPRNEVQKIQITSVSTGGTFTLTFDGQTTGTIPYNGTASQVLAALEALSNIAVGDVVVTGGPGPSAAWYVTFQGAYQYADVALMTMAPNNLTGGNSINVAEVTKGKGKSNAIYYLNHAGTAGSIRFRYGTTTYSPYVAFNAPAATVQAALENTAGIGVGNVLVDGGYDAGQALFFIQFVGSLAGVDVTGLELDTSALSPSTSGALYRFGQGGQNSRSEWQFFRLGNETLQATAGTYRLTYNGEQTAPLQWNASQADINAALNALPGLANYDITVYGGVPYTAWGSMFYFGTGALANTDVPLVSVQDSGLTYPVGATADLREWMSGAANTNEVQSVTVNGSTGTFTLTFDGQTTGAISVGSSAATVDTALEALSNIGAGEVAVTGSGTPISPYLITFSGTLGGRDLPLMTANASGVGGGAGSVTTTQTANAGTNAQQTITIGAGVTGGTFTVTFRNVTSDPIAYNAAAATVDSALEAVPTIGTGNVSVTGSAGGPWTVEFTGALATQAVELLVGNGSGLIGGAGSQALVIDTTTRSAGPNHLDDVGNLEPAGPLDSGEVLWLESGSVGPLYGLRLRSTFTANATTDVLTLAAAADFVNDQKVRVRSTGTLPAGLVAGTDYYVKGFDPDTRVLQLSATLGGSAVNMTDAGTGTHTVEVQLAGVRVLRRFTGQVGLPQFNAAGYVEYRATYLEVGLLTGSAENVTIGEGAGSGSSRLRFDFGASKMVAFGMATGGTSEPSVPSCLFKTTHAESQLETIGGNFGVAFFPTETSTLALLRMRSGNVSLGAVDLSNFDRTGGTIVTSSEATLNGAFMIRG